MSAVGHFISSFATTTAGVVCNQAALASGVTLEFPLPRTWSLIGDIRVTVQGLSSGDGVTHAELVEAITDFRIMTTKGTEVHFNSGLDLSKWSAWCMWGNNKIAAHRIGFADDQAVAITYVYPLGLGVQKWYNGDGDFFGLPGHMADRLLITFATNACFDNHLLTVEYDGIKDGPMPIHYQCCDVYSYTATAANQLNDIRLPEDALLRGVFAWSDINFNVDGIVTTLSTSMCQIVKSNRVVLETQPLTRQYGMQQLEVDDPVPGAEGGFYNLENDEHWFWDLDFGEGGHGYEIDADHAIRIRSGADDAVRIYRVYYSLTTA